MKREGTYLSIVICTYNRADRLEMLFDALRKLRIDDSLSAEFIFVDNNSSDNTRPTIETFAQSVNFQVHYLFEKKRGSSAARNAGINLASGAVIVFLDDDCFPTTDWLANIANYFSGQEVDVAGGKVLLFNPLDLPLSIRTSESEICLEELDQLFGTIPGCNMAFRRNVLEQIGVFDEDLGAGLPLAAEDVDLIYRALRKGYRLRYTPTFCVYHNHGRRTQRDASMLNRSYVKGRGGLYAKYTFAKDWQMAKRAYWEITRLFGQAAGRLIKWKSPAFYLTDIICLTQGFALVSWRIIWSNKHSVDK